MLTISNKELLKHKKLILFNLYDLPNLLYFAVAFYFFKTFSPLLSTEHTFCGNLDYNIVICDFAEMNTENMFHVVNIKRFMSNVFYYLSEENTQTSTIIIKFGTCGSL